MKGMMLLLVLLLVMAAAGDDKTYWQEEQQLRQALFDNYRRDVKPTSLTRVNVGKLSINYLRMDEERNAALMNVYYRMEWSDPRLAWDPDQFPGVRRLSVLPSDVWMPDLTVYSGENPDRQLLVRDDQYHGLVSPNGTLLFVPSVRLSLPCFTDSTYWPADTATCSFKAGSWMYSSLSLDLQLTGQPENLLKTSVDSEGGEGGEGGAAKARQWAVVSARSERQSKVYDCCPEAYISVLTTFHLRRCAPAFTWLVKAPFACLSVATVALFLVPVGGARAALGAGLLVGHLLLLTLTAHYAQIMPLTTPIIVKLEVVQMVGVTVALLVSGLVALLSHSAHSRPLPAVMRGLVTALLHLFCLNPAAPQGSVESPLKSDRGHEEKGEWACGWREVGVLLDRVCLLLTSALALLLLSFSSGLL